MKKSQWITAVIAVFVVLGLYAATQKKLFGPTTKKLSDKALATSSPVKIDSILAHAKTHLQPHQATRLNFLEHSITRGDVKEQKLHVYHQLANFWKDTMRAVEPTEWFVPFAWYTAEAARLENSEKSLTFAAHLLLNNLIGEQDQNLKQWKGLEAKDLFERSLKLNPDNDSTRVGLGAVILHGGIGAPMEGIAMIREVAQKDSNNVFAHWTLGQASLMSRQLDKAIERFKKVAQLQPGNPEAILLVADIAEEMGNKEEAVVWYGKLLPLIQNLQMRKEVEDRISKLKNQINK